MGRAFAKDPASARSPQRQPGRSRPSKELDPGALDAMAMAARRARSAAPDGTIGVTGASTPPGRPPAPGPRPADRHRRDRRLVVAIGIVAVALVLVTGGLIGSLTSHGTAEPGSTGTGRHDHGQCSRPRRSDHHLPFEPVHPLPPPRQPRRPRRSRPSRPRCSPPCRRPAGSPVSP